MGNLLTSDEAKQLPIEDVQSVLDSFTFKTPPLDHQKRCLVWALDRKRLAYWLDVGTGKSLLALYTMSMWNKRKTLIVCPNPVVDTWADEIKKHTTARYVKLKGTVEERSLRMQEDHDFYIINYEGLRVLWGRKMGRKYVLNPTTLAKLPFDSLIIDEVHRCKSHKSFSAKCAREMSRRVQCCIVMTGTPLTKDQRDLWAEMAVMDLGRTLGTSYWTFIREHFYPRGFDWVLKKDALGIILKKLSHSTIRFERDECFELPDKTYETRTVELTKEQRKLTDAAIIGAATDELNMAAALNCGNKLAQIAGGFLMTDDEVKLLKPNPKLDELASIVEEVNGKFIVYHHFVVEGQLIENLFRKLKIPFRSVRGEIKDQEKQICDFKNNPMVRALIAHPACGGEGINLYEAATIIFYSNDFSHAHRVQAEGRIYRLGQTQKCLYIDIIALNDYDSIDIHILDALKNKRQMAEVILDYIRGRKAKNG